MIEARAIEYRATPKGIEVAVEGVDGTKRGWYMDPLDALGFAGELVTFATDCIAAVVQAERDGTTGPFEGPYNRAQRRADQRRHRR